MSNETKKEKTEKQSIKEIISNIFFCLKESFKADPFGMVLYQGSDILRRTLPISEAYFASQVIGSIASYISDSSPQNENSVWFWVSLSALNLVATYFVFQLNSYAEVRYANFSNIKISVNFLKIVSELDVQHKDSPDFATSLERASDTASFRFVSVVDYTMLFVASLISLLTLSYLFFQVNPWFIVLILTPIGLRFFTDLKFSKTTYFVWDSAGEESKLAQFSSDSVLEKKYASESKIYALSDFFIKKNTIVTENFARKNLKIEKIRRSLLTLFSMFGAGIFVFIQIDLIKKLFTKSIDLQFYAFYIQSIQLIITAFDDLQYSLNRLIDQSRYIKDYRKIVSLPKVILAPKNAISVPMTAPKIEFRDVYFRYPNTEFDILKGVSFIINPGDRVALVGENGAGKSTLIKLLARFYDVSSGSILINDFDIKEINLDEYYKLWGILFQDFGKFFVTAKENIALGNINALEDEDGILKASKLAGSHGFIEKLNKDYDTFLTNQLSGGTELSGGQWQKIGIARGMFSDPQLIVLDEPTSALDSVAEKEVFESIFEISKESTMVMVSHRFSTVRVADKILVLENGEITEQGTHMELIEKEGLYYKMFMTQAAGYQN